MFNKLSIDDIALANRRVLVRVDFNVPIEAGRVTDENRLIESIPTIRKIHDAGGIAILCSHLGRPKGKKVPEFSLAPVAEAFAKLIGCPVTFVPDCIGPVAREAVGRAKSGDILLLENLRFYAEEEANDPEFAAELAKLADVYVNDAFGSAHRAHASTEGVTHFFAQSAAGYLMRKELEYLGKAILDPKRPFVAIIGGAKISGKIDVLLNLLNKVDAILVGGGMAYTFLAAQGYEIGRSLCEKDKIDLAREILAQAKAKGVNLLLPVDVVMVPEIKADVPRTFVDIDKMSPDLMGVDIGPKTVGAFNAVLRTARTVVMNGPMGVFEIDHFAAGTNQICKTLAEITQDGAITIIGGGDSAAAIAKAGFADQVSHISTGGGASLEFLEGKVLPGVAALTDLP